MSVKRILVIAPDRIADAVMAQALLALLKRQSPLCIIDVLASPTVAPVLRAMVEVSTVLEEPFAQRGLQWWSRWQYARQLKNARYAEAYVLPDSFRSALLPWLAGIPQRIGYKGENRYGLINVMQHAGKLVARTKLAMYAALANASALTEVLPPALPRPVLKLARSHVSMTLQALHLDEQRPLIAFAPGTGSAAAKRWPTRHFAGLAHDISQYHPTCQIVLLGSQKDADVCTEIQSMAPQVINLAGKTHLYQAIAILAQTQAVVSNDTAMLQIASALNRPVIALYGPTNPDDAPPFSDVSYSLSLHLPCSPCNKRECPLGHQHCMQKLNSEIVWEKLSPLAKISLI